MNLILKASPFIFITLIFFQGCYRDEILIPSQPSNGPNKLGVYVLSEGRGQPDQSKLSFLSFANGDFNLNITFPDVLGLYPDGIVDYNGTSMYITERGNFGGAGKIYQIDSNGIIGNSSTFGLNPYSLAAVNGKAYCTNGPDSSVSVINLTNLAVIKKIKVGLYPQEILAVNNNVYVANTKITGGGIDSTVSVISSTSDQEIFRIKVNAAPSALAISRDGYVLVGTPGNNGTIYKISPSNTFQKVDSFSVNSSSINDISVDYTTNNIYFIRNHSSIVGLDLSSGVATTIITSTKANTINYLNGYAFDAKNRKHYLVDAEDFNSLGFLYKYNTAGQLEQAFQTGIAPRRILIRN